MVADDTAPADFAAIDVIVQAEHGPDGLAWLITWSTRPWPTRSTAAIDRLVAASPRRADIEATLAEGGYAVLVDGPEQAIAVANLIAPEHLELHDAPTPRRCAAVRHAGAVFCGPLVAGLGRRLRRRPEPRAAHLRLGPLRRRPHRATTSSSTSTSSPLDEAALDRGRAPRRPPSPRPRA